MIRTAHKKSKIVRTKRNNNFTVLKKYNFENQRMQAYEIGKQILDINNAKEFDTIAPFIYCRDNMHWKHPIICTKCEWISYCTNFKLWLVPQKIKRTIRRRIK